MTAFDRELVRLNVSPSMVVPPFVRLLWRMGVYVSPVPYWSWVTILAFGEMLGIACAALLALLHATTGHGLWPFWGYGWFFMAMTAAFSATLLAVRWYYRRRLRGLPKTWGEWLEQHHAP